MTDAIGQANQQLVRRLRAERHPAGHYVAMCPLKPSHGRSITLRAQNPGGPFVLRCAKGCEPQALRRATDPAPRPQAAPIGARSMAVTSPPQATHEDQDDGPRSLAEVLQDPDILNPPEPFVSNLIYPERITLLSGREKSGKSTLLGLAAAALSSGSVFLGERLPGVRVLWLALDEPVGDVARRAQQYGASPEDFLIAEGRPASPAALREWIERFEVDVVFIDSLTDWWSGFVQHEKDAGETSRFLKPYVRVVRDTGIALVIVHHLPKGDGNPERYRGSTAIGATVDLLGTLTPVSGEGSADDGRRTLRVKGRGGVNATTQLGFDGERYMLGDKPMSLERRVLQALDELPATGTELATLLEGRKENVLAATRALEAGGWITRDQSKRRLTLTPAGRDRLLGPEPGAEPSGSRRHRDGN